MKYTLLSLVLALSSANAFANGTCENTVRTIAFTDSYALFCKNGCNVMSFIGPIFKNTGKKDSLSTNVTFTGTSTEGAQQYNVVVNYTDDKKNTTEVSNYDITTNDSCLIKNVTRK